MKLYETLYFSKIVGREWGENALIGVERRLK